MVLPNKVTSLISGMLAKMTLSEKVGQLLMVGFTGYQAPRELVGFLSAGKAGGIILFANNLAEPPQVAALTGTLQAAAGQCGPGLPLFIAVDQEGGAVIRLSRGVTVFPGNMALGATGREDLAYLSGQAVATELAALGINMNLAPVLDVNLNPANPVIGVRSFGEDPETVARLGVAALQGMQDGGVLAVGKHFPGHGDTTVDSHLNLPVIPHSPDRLEAVELKPFQAAIDHGISCIMTAHVVFPALESAGLPATLSAAVLTGLLRRKMGFQGLIITDCLEMKAIAANYELEEAVARAVLAGADQLLISHTFAKQQAAHEALLALAERGALPLDLLDAAVGRILTYKLALANSRRQPAAALQAADWGEHIKLAQEIAVRSVTLVRNRSKLLPLQLTPEAKIIILAFQKRLTGAEGTQEGLVNDLAGALAPYYQQVAQQILPADPSPPTQQSLQAELAAEQPTLIIAATQNARENPGQAELIRKLAADRHSLVVVSLNTPYDLLAFPEIDTYVAAYGWREVTLRAVVQLLRGEIRPQGKLPVSIPGLYHRGYGMADF